MGDDVSSGQVHAVVDQPLCADRLVGVDEHLSLRLRDRYMLDVLAIPKDLDVSTTPRRVPLGSERLGLRHEHELLVVRRVQ